MIGKPSSNWQPRRCAERQEGSRDSPSNEYEVAVSNYLASGGDNFTAFEQGR